VHLCNLDLRKRSIANSEHHFIRRGDPRKDRGTGGGRPIPLHHAFDCCRQEPFLIYPSIVSPDKYIQGERPFKGETWWETAFPPNPPCKIPMVKCYRLANAYRDSLHVNVESLTPRY
jgi:hypothetical protein